MSTVRSILFLLISLLMKRLKYKKKPHCTSQKDDLPMHKKIASVLSILQCDNLRENVTSLLPVQTSPPACLETTNTVQINYHPLKHAKIALLNQI